MHTGVCYHTPAWRAYNSEHPMISSTVASTPTRRIVSGTSGGTVIVTPPQLKRGQCKHRSLHQSCFCWKAGLPQNSQSCNSRIHITNTTTGEEGDCIMNRGGNGWVHVRCERDESRGLSSIMANFQPLRNAGRWTKETRWLWTTGAS